MEFMIIVATKNGSILSINYVDLPDDPEKARPKLLPYLNSLSANVLRKEYMWNVCATTTLHDSNGAERIQYVLSRCSQ